MAGSGKGSSGAGSGSYSGAGKTTCGGVGGVYGSPSCGYGLSKGLYGFGGIYGGVGIGYGKMGIFNNRLNGYLSEALPYMNKAGLLDLYSKNPEALKGLKTEYSLSDMISLLKETKLERIPDFYRRRKSLEKIIKPCPFCGRDSLICGCRN